MYSAAFEKQRFELRDLGSDAQFVQKVGGTFYQPGFYKIIDPGFKCQNLEYFHIIFVCSDVIHFDFLSGYVNNEAVYDCI